MTRPGFLAVTAVGCGVGISAGLAEPGTGGAGVIPAGSGGLGSARFGFGLISGGPTATRFPLGPNTVPRGGARFFGGW